MNLIDHLSAIAKSGAACIPIGSSIVTLIDEYVPSAHDRANAKAAEIFMNRLVSLEKRLDKKHVKKDEFADLFKNCLFVINRTQHEEKLRAAANILANALLKKGDSEKLEYYELDHFTRCLESLSLGAIHVLGVAVELDEQDLTAQAISHRLKMDSDLVLGLLKELENCDFLRIEFASVRYNNKDMESIMRRPMASKFVMRILKPGSPADTSSDN